MALLWLGEVATLVRYHGEDHAPLWWGPANYADYWQRIVDWFDHYLSGRRGASWRT